MEKVFYGFENTVIFIEEESNGFILSLDFARFVKESGNYFVIVSRESIYSLPYSINEIYTIENKQDEITLAKNHSYTLRKRKEITMKNNKMPIAPIQDERGILAFNLDGYSYMVNVNSEDSREHCKNLINQKSQYTYEWFKEKTGKEHWVLYNTKLFEVYYDVLHFIGDKVKGNPWTAPRSPLAQNDWPELTIPINATSCESMFSDCYYVDLSQFNTVNVVNMAWMFDGYRASVLDVSFLNTSNVEAFIGMFIHCSNLRKLDLSHFGTVKVTTMSYMFYNCKSLEWLDLSSFITENTRDMSYMFWNCRRLVSIDFSSFVTSNVVNINSMFEECISLPRIELYGLNTKNVINAKRMFYNCVNLKDILVTSNFNLDLLDEEETGEDSTYRCPGFPFNPNAMKDLNTPSAPSQDSKSLLHFTLSDLGISESTREDVSYTVDVAGRSIFDKTYAVSINSEESREKCKNHVNKITGKRFDWFKESFGMEHWVLYDTDVFEICKENGLNYLHCKNPIKVVYAMADGSALAKPTTLAPVIPLNATSCRNMFKDCTSIDNLDLTNFYTNNVVEMDSMFENCSKIKELDLSSFDTSRVTSMSFMFKRMYKLQRLNLVHFNTELVTDMQYMFAHCGSLLELDLTGFDTSRVEFMQYMFYDCVHLYKIRVSEEYVFGDAVKSECMFDGCVNLPNYEKNSRKISECFCCEAWFGYLTYPYDSDEY